MSRDDLPDFLRGDSRQLRWRPIEDPRPTWREMRREVWAEYYGVVVIVAMVAFCCGYYLGR